MARSIKSVVLYLSEAEVIAVNEKMVAQFGGLHGVKDLYLLQLAVGRPQMSVGFRDARGIQEKRGSQIYQTSA
ncbi:MAG: hypothetical protein US80_C0016G0002 [Candidatus Daviesbacteria bacterium GW2011_GWA2_38_17]|nr:MAG: hypothetical protein US80_C0016G0002 [Candidatus Daviesbacteria bacterium GW2011_GWA2_38_17]